MLYYPIPTTKQKTIKNTSQPMRYFSLQSVTTAMQLIVVGQYPTGMIRFKESFEKRLILITYQLKEQLKQTMSSNTSKRGWTPEEDQIILEILAECPQDKHQWVEISRQLCLRTGKNRTGKQCRERWQHQLNPSIVREEWTQAEVQTLFQLQAKFGNKWAQIAAFLPGRTDNAVKNFFYSSVRRVLTKINLYMSNQRGRKEFKTVREFHADYMSKLMAVVDGNYEKRLRLANPETSGLAKGILEEVRQLVFCGVEGNGERIDQKLESLILMMHEFRKSCRKRKQCHNFNAFEVEGQSSSLEEGQQIKDSSLSSSLSSENFKESFKEVKAKSCGMNTVQTMVCQSTQKHLQSQHTIEQDCFKVELGHLQIKKIDSFCFQVPMLRGLSGIVDETKEKLWNYFEEYNSKEDYLKMEEERFEEKYGDELDIFSTPVGYREDYLGVSRNYEATQGVTKFKMLEVSLALDQCLLKAKQSRVEHSGNPE